MSKELMGADGYAVGSDAYFRRLHERNGVSEWIADGAETDYRKMLRGLAERARRAADEIYEDLREHIRTVRYFPRERREKLAEVMRGLRGLCALASDGGGRCGDCEAILTLSDYDTRTSSGADDREIEAAAKLAGERTYGVELVRKAAEYGTDGAAGGSVEKALFLRALAEGRERVFFQDVLCSLRYLDDSGQLTGRNGAVLCSDAYIERIERRVFSGAVPRGGDYAEAVRAALEGIWAELERDLARGERENAYLTDENAEKITDACKALASCGVSCYALEDKAKNLAWFVGGDAEKIRRLQHSLNELGLDGDSLTEDGVYGRKTEAKWDAFMRELLRGAVPTLAWVDPLQSGATGVYTAMKVTKSGQQFSRLMRSGYNQPIFRADLHPYQGNPAYYHINVDALPGSSARQRALAKGLDHVEISENAYRVLKNFNDTAKIVRAAGKVLLVAGAALDALELYQTVQDDLQDADRKIGKKTYSEIASIGGSWSGATLGAKSGAMAGAAIGTAILPGIGTAVGGIAGGLILGIVGSYGGSTLGKWVVDITCAEE